MRKLEANHAGQELQGILQSVRNEPVSIESGGFSVAIVLSPQAYADLLSRCGARRAGGRRALTTNANDLFGFDADVFGTDGP